MNFWNTTNSWVEAEAIEKHKEKFFMIKGFHPAKKLIRFFFPFL